VYRAHCTAGRIGHCLKSLVPLQGRGRTAGNRSCTYFRDRFISDISINPANGNCYYASYRYTDEQWETGYLNVEANYAEQPILGNKYSYIRRIKSLSGIGAQRFLVLQSQT